MYSSFQNKSKNKPNSQSIKKQRPKPEFTTDFVDRQQYKLTESQRIQKKASLQSKHRQDAKRQLEQRRKKLQMGIIDDQTRKIYETALISKNIDINPPNRRNLTQMIKYQRQQKYKNNEDQNEYNESQNQQDFDEFQKSERQLKEAQNFIKKFQKAKKQNKIQRAVQMLTNNKSIEKKKQQIQLKQFQTKQNNFLNSFNEQNSRANKSSNYNPKSSKNSQSFSQDDALLSIEDTIRFMEQKLFAAKKTVDEHSKSFISEANDSFENQKIKNFKLQQKQTIMPSKTNFKKSKQSQQPNLMQGSSSNFDDDHQELQFGDRIAQISQLRIKLKDQDVPSSDDECLDTIRRMRQMMDSRQNDYEQKQNKMMKQNLRDNATPSVGTLGFNSTISKRSYQSVMDSQAQVSFNLTVNNDDQYQESSILNLSKSKFKNSDQRFINKQQQFNFDKNKKVNLSNKQNKEDKYEQEYQKIKQNLFSCINSNIQEDKYQLSNNNISVKQANTIVKYDEDSYDQSEDSLMVRDKITLWKKQLEHQVEPQDEDEQQINFKTKNFTKKPQPIQKKIIIKQQEDESEEEQDQVPYKYNFLSQKNQNMKSLDKYQQQVKQDNNSYPMKQSAQYMKKPPIVKKNQNNDKFEQMKKMISNCSNQVQNIQIQPLRIEPLGGTSEVLGFDFRGSINIKKNILTK